MKLSVRPTALSEVGSKIREKFTGRFSFVVATVPFDGVGVLPTFADKGTKSQSIPINGTR